MNPFQRTVCACDKCKACCKEQPGFLIPNDILRIGQFLGSSPEPFLWASQGAVVRDQQKGIQFKIRTITPRTVKDGRCIFLKEDDSCAIHAVAPFGCAFFDTHMTTNVANERSSWALREIQKSPAYVKFRSGLPLAMTYKPVRIRL